MDAKSTFLAINILVVLVILTGLIVTIIGIKRKKTGLIALGVLIALLPTMVSFFS